MLESEGDGLLGGMRVVGAFVHEKLLHHRLTQFGLGQHAFHPALDDADVVLFQHFHGQGNLQAARVVRKVFVFFLVPLVAGETDFFGVENDDVIARVGVGGVGGLILAAQNGGQLGAQAASHLIFGIHHVPLALGFLRTDGLGPVTQRVHAIAVENVEILEVRRAQKGRLPPKRPQK